MKAEPLSPKEILQGWFEKVWNERNNDYVFQYMAEDCDVAGLPSDSNSPKNFLAFRDAIIKSIPDLKIEDIKLFAEGNEMNAIFVVKGTHALTNKAVAFRVASYARFEGSKLVQAINICEWHTFLEQIAQTSLTELAKNLNLAE